jgi:hypothetical protein
MHWRYLRESIVNDEIKRILSLICCLKIPINIYNLVLDPNDESITTTRLNHYSSISERYFILRDLLINERNIQDQIANSGHIVWNDLCIKQYQQIFISNANLIDSSTRFDSVKSENNDEFPHSLSFLLTRTLKFDWLDQFFDCFKSAISCNMTFIKCWVCYKNISSW